MPPLSPKEFERFLTKTRYIGRLGTLLPDGSPYVTPVWFEWDGKKFYIMGKPLAQYVKNVERDPRAYLVVDREKFPYMRVNVQGQAKIVGRRWSQRWVDMGNRMIKRYLGEVALKYAAARMKYGIVMIELTPEKINSWKVTDFPPDRTFTEPARWREV
ncbi:MAG: pyridoxamine 5'-phosphate oxidase family protein [Deinococcus sp.]|nr:pyridoxamine 5'-phosphate oxidase family protein [Deinococcus sp.]